MERPRAAEREQREIARIVAFLDRHQADGAGQMIAGDGDDRRRRLDGVEPERRADLLDECRLDGFDRHAAGDARQGGRVELAQHQVGIGHGRFGAAAAVADRAGIGAGTVGSDLQDAGLGDARDRAAAGADRVDVDHRHANRHAVGDVLLRRQRGLAAADQGHVEAGAAHVAADQVGMARLLADAGGGERAGRRSRHHGLHGIVGGGLAAHRAAIALHDQKLGGEAGELQLLLQPAEIARHDRLDVAVDRGRRAALELANLAQDVGADRDEGIGPELARDLAGAPFVRRIDVGMQEADDQRLGAAGDQKTDGASHGFLVERRQDVAAGVEALGHFDTQLARDEGFEAADHAVAEGPRAAPQFQHVAETDRGDQAADDALALEDRVGADSGAMHQGTQRVGGQAAVANAGHHAARLIVGRGGYFRDAEAPLALVNEKEIGESTADIDAGLPLSHPATPHWFDGHCPLCRQTPLVSDEKQAIAAPSRQCWRGACFVLSRCNSNRRGSWPCPCR